MRFERGVVHPAIFRATDEVIQNLWMTGQFQGSPEQARAFHEHQRVWWKEYGNSILVGSAAFILAFAASVWLKRNVGAEIGGPAMFMTFIGGVAACIVGYRKNKRSLSVTELRAILPALTLSPIQRIYAESLVNVAELNLPADQYLEIVGQLNRLLGEEERLTSLKTQNISEPARPDDILIERDHLAARVASATDPVSKEALARSLEICESRLKASVELSRVGERVDAQLTMIDQAIRGIRDSLRRLRMSSTSQIPSIDMEAVRQSVDMAHQHSAALEQAVQEIRTLA